MARTPLLLEAIRIGPLPAEAGIDRRPDRTSRWVAGELLLGTVTYLARSVYLRQLGGKDPMRVDGGRTW
jgi:hypothetical protein